MDSGDPFKISFVTYDKRRKTGGKWIQVDEAIESGQRNTGKAAASASAQDPISDGSKNPNHRLHGTRNIIILPSKKLRKVNIRLIKEFNGAPVIW
jgi:hypothetical protein